MPTLNIKDPEVYRLAAELAERRHTSMTAAVRQALGEALARDRREKPLGQTLAEAAARWRAEGGTVVPEDELYDENGLPG